ncbi:MAG: SgcJ/EcaC family oxidoreductase [Planctomycetes bacterium]|nr:SgcJ/EcaC family oxidoreductase [Planctomycetota bacterium]
MRGILGLALCLGAALTVSQFSVAGKAPTTPFAAEDKAKAADAPGKGKRAQAFIAAFEKGDAKATAAFWTPEGEYTDQVGRQYKGREAIEKLYAKVFAVQKGAKLSITVTSHKLLGTDVGLEEGITEVTPADGGPGSIAKFSAVLVKKDGEWYFESLKESIAHPPTNAEHYEDLEWLLGDWVGEAEKGPSGTASYGWAENRNFIVSSFATTLNGVPVIGGTQWIGWDAIDKQIRSWSFYSGGGIGEGTWTKDGAKWTVKTTAKTADGKKISLTNVLTKVDDDHLTWHATQLTVDGKAIPDGSPVKMKRVK